MCASPSLRLAYLGDDFTGSTDALEFLTRAGLRTRLFLEPPTPPELARHPELEAIGVAGLTRSLAPDAMEKSLREAFSALRALGAPHVHYKVCSTFDSSPTVGSIGRAIDVGAEIFRSPFVPLLVGAPALGRYCVFGNLFARMGIGSAGEIHRLDRHPSMMKHPVTPADESDLRRHLSRQTVKRIELLDILQIARPVEEARVALQQLLQRQPEIVLFDILYPEHLAKLGELIDAFARAESPLFSVGSSGVEMALGAWWTQQRLVTTRSDWSAISATPTLVVSGSCSPVTDGQIKTALSQGFVGVPFSLEEDAQVATEHAISAFRGGANALVYTSRGVQGRPAIPAERLGTALGNLARTVLAQTSVRRVLIAGGDTSSYAARALGIRSVDMLAPLAPGAPLCRAYAEGSPADGIEINFKGGQVGAPDYFCAVAKGKV